MILNNKFEIGNELNQKWMNLVRKKCSEDEQLLAFLSFIETSNARYEIGEYDIETLQQKRDPYTYGRFYIGAVEIGMYLYQADNYQMKARIGVDYKGYWNKFYDCIIETYFPMSRRDYATLEHQIIGMIGDRSKGRDYYQRSRKMDKERTKTDRRKGGVLSG